MPRGAWGGLDPPAERAGWLRADVVAGLTVTAYLIPQVMAYAELAGLPAVTGLWAAMGGLAGYALIGSSRYLSAGPESTTAIMTAAALGATPAAREDPASFATALTLVVAALCVLAWAVRLAVLAELLSRPVLVGYMAGIAVIMVVTQLDNLTGIEVDNVPLGDEVWEVLTHLEDTHLPTLAVGLTCLVLMLAISARWSRAPVALIGLASATAVTVLLDLGDRGVDLVGTIPSALPTVGLPDVSLDVVPSLLGPALGIAFVGFTDNVLTARAFAERHRDRVSPTRELLAMGTANLGAGLLHGFPVSSSASRTAIVDAVGGRTRWAGVVTLVATLVALLTLLPVLANFPTAALGAVVVYAAVRLVDVGELRRFASFRRSELVLALVTAGTVLVFGVLIGVVAAIGLSILDLLRRVARPHDAVEGAVPGVAGFHDVDDYPDARQQPGLLIYRYDSPLFFANAEDFRSRALAAVDSSTTPVDWFVLNTEAIIEVDITAVDGLESLRRELASRGIVMAVARIKQDLRELLEPSGILDRIGEDHVFYNLRTACEAHEAWRESRGTPLPEPGGISDESDAS